jgi:hypothetical protein
VQMEFGTKYRRTGAVDTSARDAAKAIVAFYDTYLRKPPN